MLTRIALAVTLLAANSIAATNAYAARGVSIANFGHSFGAGRYYPPQPTLRQQPIAQSAPVERDAAIAQRLTLTWRRAAW